MLQRIKQLLGFDTTEVESLGEKDDIVVEVGGRSIPVDDVKKMFKENGEFDIPEVIEVLKASNGAERELLRSSSHRQKKIVRIETHDGTRCEPSEEVREVLASLNLEQIENSDQIYAIFRERGIDTKNLKIDYD